MKNKLFYMFLMEFIKNQSKKFNKLVYNYFITNYKLQKTNCINDLKKHNNTKNLVWINNNYMIISNSIINYHYKTNLDENKYSLISILYKNLYYKEKHNKELNNKKSDNKNVYLQNICYLESFHKNKIKTIWTKLSKNINLDKDIIIISRKYYNKQNTFKKYFNCFELLCLLPVENIKNKKKNSTKSIKYDDININFNIKDLRRKFLYNLKSHFNDVNLNSIYLKKIMNNCLFLDVEYINDLYDDFTKFPISADNSLLCMIGMSYFKNNIMKYDNLIVKKLDYTNEYDILKTFLNKILNKQDLIIFHWSNADKLILEKSLIKYPDLWEIYSGNKIIYIDLLKVVKNTIILKSYSLKYVSEILLKYKYETECKNGLDAMCSIILNGKNLTDKNFKNINDIIQYNKIDTQLLYVILDYFIGNYNI